MRRPVLPEPIETSDVRTNTIVTHILQADETADLVRRVKENGTTIAGAVGAAALLAVRHEQLLQAGGRPKAPIGLQVNLCLRPNAVFRGHEDMRQTLGATSVPIYRAMVPERTPGTWPLAKAVRKEISKGIRTGEWVETIKEMGYLRLTHKWSIGGIKYLHEKFAQGRIAGVSLSSMGDLDAALCADANGPIQAIHCMAGIDVARLGPYALVVCLTLKGRLCFSVTTASPMTSKEQSQRMIDRIVQVLTEM